MADATGFRFVSSRRRVREDRRFVSGRGRFVADVNRPGMKHVALVTSPHASARILAVETAEARRVAGVRAVVSGAEVADATEPLMTGVDLPRIRRRPMAVERARYAGEWVAAVVADSRHEAEDGAERVEVEYEPLPCVVDPEAALAPDAPLVHPEHGSNVLYRRTFTWGDVARAFAASPHRLRFRARWGRSATVPVETFGVVAEWSEADGMLDVWASVQMPKFPDQIARALRLPGNAVRVHHDVDVGGSYGVKRGIKHAVVVGYLARKLGFPVRLLEDRLENMAGGDAHGPDRIFDVEVAFDGDGRVRSMRMRALDDAGATPGRAPLQLGKPVTAIVGPYRIESVEYEAISVSTHKTTQEAVRGFGQAPTNFAIESALDRVAGQLGLDRLEVRRRNFIRAHEFPYLIPSGTTYDSGDYHAVLDKTTVLADWPALVARRDALRAAGRLAGIGVATCLEPSGGNAAFEPLFNPKNETSTWMEGCQVRVDALGDVTAVIGTTSAGQGHETLVATVLGEALGRDPDTIRVVRSDSLSSLPGNSPVGSRMAIMLGGAVAGAAEKLKERLVRIAAHALQLPPDRLVYRDGDVIRRDDPGTGVPWLELVTTAHRRAHRMPVDAEPGLHVRHVYEVPTGGELPDAEGRVHIYPCYSFEAHVPLVEIDPLTGQVSILAYYLGHDCGTVINPDIVHGMVYGGVAHGIGAALYERFEYDPGGQLLSGSFADYLMPTTHEVPRVEMVEHCTPSPHTSHGQKGSGEAGYLGAPAALASAVNDALAPLGASLLALPMRPMDIESLIRDRESP